MTPRLRLPADRLWTEDEFLALPETQQRVELLDGELVRQPGAGYAHQRHVGALHRLLCAWAATRSPPPEIGLSPIDIRFGPGRILQPDVFVVIEPLAPPVRTPLEAIPDLCIEVVSRDRTYDRVTKRQVYAEASVRECWTVVSELGFLERWTGERLAQREELRERLVTPLLPGFELDVAALLKEP